MKDEEILIKKDMTQKQKLRVFFYLGKPSGLFFELVNHSLVTRDGKGYVFMNNKDSREDCCRKLGISAPTFSQHLKSLVEKNFVKSISVGKYELDYDLASFLSDYLKNRK
jgi:DNA-binding transcriptional ArsR family regulator